MYIMKTINIFLFLLIGGCSIKSDNVKNKKSDIFFYKNICEKGILYSDTFNIEKIKKHDKDDSLIYRVYFNSKGKFHELNAYTNEKKAPTDAERIFYELSEIGIIYTKSLSWYDYSVLKSSNDSINEIIENAFEIIIFWNKKEIPKIKVYNRMSFSKIAHL